MNKFVMDVKGFTIAGEDVYFCTYRANGVFKFNISTGKVDYVTMTDTVKPIDCNLYADIKLVGTKLWFVPCYTVNDIFVYDIVSGEKEYISVPMTESDKQSDRFGAVYEYKEWLIFTPLCYPAIVKINKENHEMKLISWKEPLLKAVPDFLEVNKIAVVYYDFEVLDNTMYLLAENVVIKYNMETDEVSFVKICDEPRVYCGIVYYNNAFILVDRLYSEVVRWNETDGSIQKIETDLGFLGEELQDPGYPFGACKIENQVVLMQQFADYLLLINSDWKINRIPLNIGEYKRTDVKFQQYKLIEGKLYMPLFNKNAILIVDTSDWSQKVVEFGLEQIEFEEVYKRIEQEMPIINEGILYYQLEKFLQGIKMREFDNLKEVEVQGKVGMKIYEV